MQTILSHEMTAGEVLRSIETALEKAGIPEAGSDAWLIFEKASSFDRTDYSMKRAEKLPEEAYAYAEMLLNKRLTGMPVQYVLGEAWFYGYRFHVEPGVLIPRFDTEVLVAETLKQIVPGMKVLDLCTGSGCIIIAAAKESEIKGYGSDISDKALETARRNNDELSAGCVFIKSDLFDGINETFDIIVSNPPYIRTGDIEELQTEVKDHEPFSALDGGSDGLVFYRKIACEAPGHLNPEGSLLLEIGYDQADDVAGILEESGFCDIIVVKDLSGNDRVIKAKLRS